MSLDKLNRVYKNNGNHALMSMLEENATNILNVGCGAGDNAALAKSRNPNCEVYGVTWSITESNIARKYLTACWVFDINEPLPAELRKNI